jgi:hypothetical protein
MAARLVAGRRDFIGVARSGRHLVEEALGVAVEIAEPIGLQAIGEDAVEQVARQMVGRLAAEHRVPSCPQAGEVQIAQMRDGAKRTERGTAVPTDRSKSTWSTRGALRSLMKT